MKARSERSRAKRLHGHARYDVATLHVLDAMAVCITVTLIDDIAPPRTSAATR